MDIRGELEVCMVARVLLSVNTGRESVLKTGMSSSMVVTGIILGVAVAGAVAGASRGTAGGSLRPASSPAGQSLLIGPLWVAPTVCGLDDNEDLPFTIVASASSPMTNNIFPTSRMRIVGWAS